MGGQRGNYGSKPVFPVLIMWIFPEIIPDYFWSGAESKLHRQTPLFLQSPATRGAPFPPILSYRTVRNMPVIQ